MENTIKKSELIKMLAESIARNGDGPICLQWEKGKRDKPMIAPVCSVQQVRHQGKWVSVVNVWNLDLRSEAVSE
jgi:hypothetical protein